MAYYPLSTTSTGTTSPPTLRDILSNTAPPPYTLGAFTAYLSQNHCLETLEFTMDAERYRTAHESVLQSQPSSCVDGNEHVSALWQKLIRAYILPCGPREVNLPSIVRDRLLSLPVSPTPPQPSELNEAVGIVYELMNDSVLVPFLESVGMTGAEDGEDDLFDTRSGRSRLRTPKESTPSSPDEPNRSPKSGFLPMLNLGWSHEHANRSSSGEPVEGLTDDSGSAGSPSGNEPMTPPTTPPASDWGFAASPTSLHRAISHSSGWKKMGEKLGLGKKSKGKHSNPGSVTSAGPAKSPL